MIKHKIISLSVLGLMGCGFFKKHNINPGKINPPYMFSATEFDYETNPINSNSKLIGYLIDGYKPTNDQLKKMTHISISFLRTVNSKGEITMTQGWENIEEVVSAAHYNDVKAIISFGGGEYRLTSELMGISKNRQNLIKNIIGFIKKYNFDGFDCDWEPSWVDDKVEMEAINNTLTDYYLIFIKEFREALDNEFGKGNKTFSAAVLNGNNIWYSSKKQIAHFPKNGWWHYLDWVSLMNYDNDLGSKHSTYKSVFGRSGSVVHWMEFGIPSSKIVTGIPFYARAGWGEDWLFYKDIRSIEPEISDSTDFILFNKNKSGLKEYGFNNKATVAKKVNTGKKMDLPGIMFWQLAGDLPVDSENSLLRVISAELGYKKDGSR